MAFCSVCWSCLFVLVCSIERKIRPSCLSVLVIVLSWRLACLVFFFGLELCCLLLSCVALSYLCLVSCFVLFCFILFCPDLFCFVLRVLPCVILCCLVLWCVELCGVVFLFYFVLSSLILVLSYLAFIVMSTMHYLASIESAAFKTSVSCVSLISKEVRCDL